MTPSTSKPPSVFSVLGPYRKAVVLLITLAIVANVLTLFLPKFVSGVIDAYVRGSVDVKQLVIQFGGITFGILVFTYLQSIVQTYASERVARDLRQRLAGKISRQSYRFIEDQNPSKLLSYLTSDVDSIKMFVSMGIVSLVSSLVIIIGAALVLLTIDWRLALVVLLIIPLIGGTFAFILGKVRKLFMQSREVIDWLNKVISESILGAALIRVLHSERFERAKFAEANKRATAIGFGILKLFSFMIPIVTFVASMATLAVVVLGGHFITQGTMTLGSFAAFTSYIAILIFPIFVLGFTSNILAQASASYARIHGILEAPDMKDDGAVTSPLSGRIDLKNVTLSYGEKLALRDVSLSILPGTKTAIIGPTAAGKTQLLNVLMGLTFPQKGEVDYDGLPLASYDRTAFYAQIGLVFQDSVLFNTTVRENIAFSTTVTDASLHMAVETAELSDFLSTLPQGLDTVVSERGTSLSGGQKQRLMLARALALNPKILFLDDFTARVDAHTEKKILANVEKNYPGLTLISITQKIAPIMDYDQIVLVMEGELLARGTHAELMRTSPEYVQIYESQRSTSTYELRA